MILKPYERRILRDLLDQAGDEFGNHGCNDYDLREQGLTLDEMRELASEVARVNYGDGPDLADELPRIAAATSVDDLAYSTPDFMLFRYFSDLAENGGDE